MSSLLRDSFGHLGPSGQGYDSLVLSDGPEAYWILNDPAGSSTIVDATGNGNTGHVSAHAPNPGLGATSAPGTLGGTCLALTDGTGNPPEYYSVAPQAGLLAALQTHDFTIEHWTEPFAGMSFGTPNLIFNAGNARSNNQQLLVDWIANNYALGFWNDDWNNPGSGPSLNVWHHTVFTFHASSLIGTWYEDGSATGTHSFGAALDVNNLGWSIGSNPNTAIGWDTFIGNLSRIAVYNYQLSATQVATHFAAA